MANDDRLESLLESAIACFNGGNIAQAELFCREHAEHLPDDPAAYELLGRIAEAIGARSFAIHYYTKALKLSPGLVCARQNRMKLLVDPQEVGCSADNKKYLLIKAWGFGFWSDVDHVLGQLLVAEITGRTPVVHWGNNSLFRSDSGDNAFELYFEPVSNCTIHDLVEPCLTYFPRRWNHCNLIERNDRQFGGDENIAGLLTLHRNEDVVVSDYYSSVYDLSPWVPEGSGYFGLPPEEIYRRLFARFLVLKPHVQKDIDEFWNRQMAGRPWLAVHVRGSDKHAELELSLERLNQDYFFHIDQLIMQVPSIGIFLLTDCSKTVQVYREMYGPRLLHTDSIRVDGKIGIHYSGFPGKQVAEEVIRDVYLAGRCDFFLGNGYSSVSTTIQHLKPWAEGRYNLIGRNRLFERNFYLHKW